MKATYRPSELIAGSKLWPLPWVSVLDTLTRLVVSPTAVAGAPRPAATRPTAAASDTARKPLRRAPRNLHGPTRIDTVSDPMARPFMPPESHAGPQTTGCQEGIALSVGQGFRDPKRPQTASPARWSGPPGRGRTVTRRLGKQVDVAFALDRSADRNGRRSRAITADATARFHSQHVQAPPLQRADQCLKSGRSAVLSTPPLPTTFGLPGDSRSRLDERVAFRSAGLRNVGLRRSLQRQLPSPDPVCRRAICLN